LIYVCRDVVCIHTFCTTHYLLLALDFSIIRTHAQDDPSPFIPVGYLFDFVWIYDRQHRFHCASELS